MQAKLFIDESGSQRAEFPAPLSLLGSFLESDIQGGAGAGDHMLKLIHSLRIQGESSIEVTGNAHHVVMTPDTVEIESLWDDTLPSLTITLDQFMHAIIEWREFTTK